MAGVELLGLGMRAPEAASLLGWLQTALCGCFSGGLSPGREPSGVASAKWWVGSFPSTRPCGLLLLLLLPGGEQMPEGAQGHLACLLQALASLCQ